MKRKTSSQGIRCKRIRVGKVPFTQETVSSAKRLLEQNDQDGLRSLLAAFSREQKRAIFQDDELRSSLHVAVGHRNLTLMTLVLDECRVDVERRNERGVTALYLAVEAGEENAVRLLLDHRATVNYTDDASGRYGCFFNSLLRLALVVGNPHVFRQLLRAGLELKMWPEPRSSLKHMALRRETLDDMVKCAMEFGLSEEKHRELLELLLEAAISHGCAAFDLLWPHRSRTADDFKRAILALEHPHGRVKTFLTIFYQGKLTFTQCLDLMEYLGAWSILYGADISYGLWHWERAMQVRWKNPDEPIRRSKVPHSLAGISGIREVQTFQDVRALRGQAVEELIPQAILIYERLRVDKAWELLLSRAVRHFEGEETERLLHFMSCMAERGKHCDDPCWFAIRVCEGFFQALTPDLDMPEEVNVFALLLPLLDNLHHALEISVARIPERFGRERHDGDRRDRDVMCGECVQFADLEIAFLLVLLMLMRWHDRATDANLSELRRQLLRFVRLDPRFARHNRLHVAALVCPFCPQLLRLLVECSAEVGGISREMNSAAHLAANYQGKTPLHILAKQMMRHQVLPVVDTFMEHGAHLCARDKSGRSVLDILEARGIFVPKCRPLSLECLAAKAVRAEKKKGTLKTDELPKVLQRYVMDH